MYICYVDEAGDTGVLPSATSPIQPVLAISAIVIHESKLKSFTTGFLSLKHQMFPHALPQGSRYLDWTLFEVKGADVRRDVALGGHRSRRHSLGFLQKLMNLLQAHDVAVFGRAWIKAVAAPMDGTAVYTSSVQAICTTFQRFLQAKGDVGLVVADSRAKRQNARVAHSIFTQKFQASGDAYPLLVEMPTFGHSENHAGLQVSDLVCSGLVFPLAVHSFCTGYVTNLHVRPGYALLKGRFGAVLKAMQFRYQDQTSRWRGGITVSDAIAKRSGAKLFS